MRKRSISHFFDTLMWYLLYLLPIIVFLVALTSMTLPDLCAFVSRSPISAIRDTFVFSALDKLFGTDGLLPMFTGSANVFILYYSTYFVYVMLLHLFVDFLVFIPRLAHKWLEHFTGGCKND